MDRSQIEDIFPLTPMQEGLLFQALFDEGSAAYFLQMSLNWHGGLQLAVFRESWRRLVARHAVLRSVFVHEGVKRPLQITLKEREPEITLTDLREMGAGAQETTIAQYEMEDQVRGFDLAKDVLLRMAIFQLGEQSFRLVWSYHHILFDGWSFGILQQEFVSIYQALIRGNEPELPAVASYKQYIRWLAGRPKDTALAHWRGYLAGYEAVAMLPRLRPPAEGFELGQKALLLNQETMKGLQQLAVRCGATLNSVIRGIWGVILGRYNNAAEVVFGAIVSGRPSGLLGVEEMVGLFINAVPVRVALDGKLPFTELVRQLQQEALKNEPYHYMPLAEIQALNPLGRNLFDHMLIFENYPLDSGEADGSEESFVIEGVGVHDRTHYDFDITIAPGAETEIVFTYNRMVYTDAQIGRLVGHWETAVASVLAEPETAVGKIEILPAAERERVISAFNDTAQEFPADVTILDLFAEQVQKHWERTAVVMGDEQLSYVELNGRVEQLARFLREQGVKTGERVAICVERSVDMVVGVLGIMRAGGAYVPIDPDYPAGRIAFMLADVRPVLVLTQERLKGQLPETEARVVAIENCQMSIVDGQLSMDPVAVEREDVAYVIYTSGSTGLPKGVMVTHGNVVNAAFCWREVYGLGTSPMRSLQMASLAFDVFMGDVVRALTNGGELVICPADVRVDPAALYQLLEQHQINIFESTPALVVPLMRYVWEQKLPIGFLEQLIIGSDSLAAVDYRWIQERFGEQMRVMNSYGVTEATIDSSLFEAQADAELLTKNTPIGRPFPNTQFYIVNANGRPAPIGVTGELVIGGAGVARGYWERPELTTQHFASMSNEQLTISKGYRTGDEARWLAGGNVEFLGRRDDQVKLRGYRIELGEIEAQLLELHGMEAAVVVLKEGQLVAYLVGKEQKRKVIRQGLRMQLPDYMVPNRFVWLEGLPLTPNGKVDRKGLRERDDGGIAAGGTYIAPRNETEEALAEIWGEVLGLEQVSIADNFFDLGGTASKRCRLCRGCIRRLR